MYSVIISDDLGVKDLRFQDFLYIFQEDFMGDLQDFKFVVELLKWKRQGTLRKIIAKLNGSNSFHNVSSEQGESKHITFNLLRLCRKGDRSYSVNPFTALHFWSCTANITKSCFMNHSCYIDPRNHILKCSLYPKESHHLPRFVISLSTKLLLNLKPD